MNTRASTVDLAAAMQALSEQFGGVNSAAGCAIYEASQRLLELRRLLDVALPAVELFADAKTMNAIRRELGL